MPRRWTLAALALLVISIALGQLYRQPLLDLFDASAGSIQVTPPPCDLNHTACPLPLMTPVASEAPWLFAISPRPIPVSAPLTLSLTPPAQVLPGNRPASVLVELTGDSMDMGLIRIPLALQPNGRWEASSSIPVCVTGQMRWRARLQMQLEQERIQADWTFNAPASLDAHPGQSR